MDPVPRGPAEQVRRDRLGEEPPLATRERGGQIRARSTTEGARRTRSATCHAAELRLWHAAGVDPVAEGRGRWYREVGQGMGPALNAAAAFGAYVLSDRGTWLAFRNRQDLAILAEGDSRLFNRYGVIAANPARHPHVHAAEAARFVAWITGPAGQAAIAAYRIGGSPLFFPNAGQPGA